MRLEENITKAIAAGHSLGFDAAGGQATNGFESPWGESAFPPPGYLPWHLLEVGNGDTYGFYWPIGQEDQPPIVCTLLHDSAALLPIASTFERALRLLRAGEVTDDEELKEVAKEFGVKLGRTPRSEPDEKVPLFFRDAAHLMKIDDASPLLLVAAARELRGKDLPGARALAQHAVELLPEYAEGWELLANMASQARDDRAVIENTLRAICAPLAFGAPDRKKLLGPLKKMSDAAALDPGDPLWKRRSDLTFGDDAKESADARLLTEAIDEYHQRNQSLRAIGLRIVLGEWMSRQTVSLQERASWKWPAFRGALRQDHVRANLTARLPALNVGIV